MPSNTLPALSSGRPFIAPRMSVGMKLAVGFLVVMGVVMVAGVMLSLAEIMHRLEPQNQAQVADAMPVGSPVGNAVPAPILPPALANAMLQSDAVTDTRNDAVLTPAAPMPEAKRGDAAVQMPAGAVVQQLVPYQGQIYLLVNVPKKGQRVMVLDVRSGELRQDIRLQNSAE